jgi:hypothetical protein
MRAYLFLALWLVGCSATQDLRDYPPSITGEQLQKEFHKNDIQEPVKDFYCEVDFELQNF